MRKKILCTVMLMFIATLCGCGNDVEKGESKAKKTEMIDKKEGIYQSLTDEQKKYLTQTQLFTEDAINEMDYEAVNWELLGTGFELYNQTSGVEVFGLSYQEEQAISEISNSNELITLEKVIEIRNKEREMKLNDFVNYKYSITSLESDSGNAYLMQVPIKGYDNTSVEIIFSREDNDVINMKAPFIKHEMGEVDSTFSILYDRDTFEAYYHEEPKYTLENKVYIGVQYSSVRENSLVLNIYNWTENEYKKNSNYELYEITDNGEKLIDSFEGEEEVIKGKSYSIAGIDFGDNVNIEKGKRYLLKYGKDIKGYLYDEVEFVR